jgi:hypothetical protein
MSGDPWISSFEAKRADTNPQPDVTKVTLRHSLGIWNSRNAQQYRRPRVRGKTAFMRWCEHA